MQKKYFGLVAAAVIASAAPVAAQPAPNLVTAYLGRTVKPNSSEKVTFYVWQATSFKVDEYRLDDATLEAALRDGSLQLDPAKLTATRNWTLQGQQGDVPVAKTAGVYVYVARGGNQPSYAEAVVVTSLGLGVKRDDTRALALVHAGDNVVSNATVRALVSTDPAKAPTLLTSSTTTPQGVATFTTPTKGNIYFIAKKGGEVAFQTTWDRSYSQPQRFVVHLQTDRPLYRPGQTAHYRAIIRESLVPSQTYRTPVDEETRTYLRDTKGNRTLVKTEKTSTFGTISGSTSLSSAAPLGEYGLEVEVGASGPNNYPVGYSSFGVEAYRKPEFKVTVTTDKSSYIQGAAVKATIKADYYFGAAVPNAKVHYTVTRQPRFRWWYPFLPIDIMPMSKMWMPWHWQPPAVVAQGDVKTAANGTVSITVPTGTGATEDADLTVDAKVTDASDREVSGSASFPVTRAAFDINISSDRYVYAPGDRVDVRASVQETSGTPAIGVQVELKAELIDNQGKATPRFTKTFATGLDGSVAQVFLASNMGQYLFTVTAKDAAGNKVTAQRTIWIQDQSGGLDWQWTQAEIIPDREVYTAGDYAFFLVKAPVKNGTGVFTLESTQMQKRVTFSIKGGLGIVVLPIAATMAPNVFATVMIPTKDGLALAEKEIQVPPTDNLVNVTITADKAEYRPGETAKLKVKARNAKGQPVRAEIALSLVDEALFGLREDATPKLTETFFSKIWNGVTTAGGSGSGGPIFFKALNMASAPTAMPAPGQAAGGNKVREYFPDTMRWVANLTTDQNGDATLTQTVADTLTTWRLTARAVTADTRVGETLSSVLVRKDLVVRLATPRTLVEGDEMTLVGIVHNLSRQSGNVTVKLDAQGVQLLDPPTKTVTIAKGDLARVTWRAKVNEAGSAVLTASATASFDQDALKLTVPVAARGVTAKRAQSGSLLKDGSVTVTLDKDARAIDPATELRVNLSPSLAGSMLDSLDHLTGYPYGCIEQTMSRFLPDVIVADVLKALGRDDSALAAKLPDMVRDGLERIQGMQNADGGFGWFGENESQPYQTAYVAYGLALAKKAGFKVPDDLFKRVVEFLEKAIQNGSLDQDGRAYACYALATAGNFKTSELVALAAKKGQLNDYSKAVLALALKLAGQNGLATDVAAALDASALRLNGRCHWEGKTITYGAWQSNTTEVTAYALRALVALDPQDPKIAETVTWLTERQQESGLYTTTKDTAAVVLALADYVRVTNELTPNLKVTVSVNGQTQTLDFAKLDMSTASRVITVPGKLLKTGPNSIVISRQGTGALYYTALLDQKVRMDPIPALEQGISVKRTFFKVTTSVDQNGQVVEDEKPLVGNVKLGDKVRVKLTLQVSKNAAVEHVNLEDRFPVGFSVVDDRATGWRGWSWWCSAREVHDDRLVFFASQLQLQGPQGGTTYEYSYDLRAEVAGTFMALPATAEAVYTPDVNGRSDGKVITID
ncbi:MAG: alpha-2-macroglobulin [Planctomycetota bacterium]